METTDQDLAESELQMEEYLKENNKRNWQEYHSTHKRFDYLIVTVNSAGVYLSLEVVKYISESGEVVGTPPKLAGVMFACAIIFNLFAQLSTFNVYHNILKLEQIKVKILKDNPKIILKKVEFYNILSSAFMWPSFVFLVLASTIMGIFLFKHF